MRFETFSPLSQIDFICHGFTLRTVDDTKADGFEERVIRTLGFAGGSYVAAEQTHGSGVAIVSTSDTHRIPAVDALATAAADLPLLVRCADCAVVFVVDRERRAIALIHSGKRGSQANIVGHTLVRMRADLGTDPGNCLALISPSIGPCHYEMNIWATIESQLRNAGISDIHNPRICTACHLDRYFSYRAEQGQTGRMFAVLALKSTQPPPTWNSGIPNP